MKKKIKISILIVFSLVFIFGLYILIRGFIIPHISEGDDFCPYKNEITILNDNYPSDIIIYGEEVEFDSRLKYRVINELSINSLTSEPEYLY